MKRKRYSFVGIPTRVLEKELERRGSLAYARNVNREYRALELQRKLAKGNAT